ncbi:choline-binding transcriptional repressor BetI [Sinisalibacter aestuarii]|uniref:HTH-type transcriptional regulator BetI n=1 Tax=Sinisalibacter aestuarii TaxID=2949426 RepID=A0ABQ5LTN4_9RHOB|nr:transcriptional regulator BetI [Sinisalibacter aestuarii]GKY88354.1 HTH-type transcriptional regulator BetI [Sinisalibacter aestuarii]
MPKLGMEPIRRAALVKAAIAEIGEVGSLDVTVSRIARRAGVSSALAHHYFGGKDDLLLAAMRHILGIYGACVRAELARAGTPRARLDALVRASFGPENFAPATVSAWLSFYVHAQSSAGARRLLTIYQRRLASNLIHDLRPLAGARAPDIATTLAATIDGLYIRHALGGEPDGAAAAARVTGLIDRLLERP